MERMASANPLAAPPPSRQDRDDYCQAVVEAQAAAAAGDEAAARWLERQGDTALRAIARQEGYEDGYAGRGMNRTAAGTFGGKLSPTEHAYQQGHREGRRDGGHEDGRPFAGGMVAVRVAGAVDAPEADAIPQPSGEGNNIGGGRAVADDGRREFFGGTDRRRMDGTEPPQPGGHRLPAERGRP